MVMGERDVDVDVSHRREAAVTGVKSSGIKAERLVCKQAVEIIETLTSMELPLASASVSATAARWSLRVFTPQGKFQRRTFVIWF
jgi:hypothetical protein